MPRQQSGYPRAGHSTRSNLTRRGLLGAAAVLTGAGIADALHKPGQPEATTPGVSPRAAASAQTKSVSEPGVVTNGTSSHHAPVPSHVPEHYGNTDGVAANPGHKAAKVEHVDLPAAKVRVRQSPVYSVDELVPDPPKHAIALTVDDGPDPDWTPKVLRILDKYRMQASFCVVGIHADSYPKLVRDVAKAGHVIVNHSYTHVMPFNHQTEKRVVAEITRTQRAIEKAAKVTPQLFRAPGGAWTPFIFRAVAAYGLTPLDWDVDPLDWEMPGTRKIERAMLRGRPGDIVLCHDGGGNRSETVRALRKVLPAWKHRGYTTMPLVVPASATMPPPTQSPTPSSSPTDSASTSPSP